MGSVGRVWGDSRYQKSPQGEPMNKYGPAASREVEKAMHEMKQGKLTSGNSDKKVTSRKQAVAIGLSKARKKGGKVPQQ